MGDARARAGKLLVGFLMVMAALTFASNALQAMVTPIVTPTTAQRGSLEHRVNADGTLAAAGTLAVTSKEAAQVTEVLAKVGQRVEAGGALMRLDYTAVLSERYEALLEALSSVVEKQQTYDWETADISKDSLTTLNDRRTSLQKAEKRLETAEETLAQLTRDGADESELRKARTERKSASDSVDYRRRYLQQYTTPRDYITAQKALVQANQALDLAWRDYFAAYAKLDGALPVDQRKLREDVLRTLAYGGSVAAMIPFDPDVPHPGTLRAQTPGEVLTLDAKVGENLSVTGPALTLGERSKGLSLTVTVSQSDAEWIAVGDESEVEIGDDRLICPVVSVSASSATEGSYDVELSIPEGYGAVGLRASMRFAKKTVSYDVLIPLGALREDGQSEFVYVIEQQSGSLGASMKVRRVDVVSLDKDATRAALQGGVTQRDVLALRSDRELEDGDRVRLEDE